MAPKSRYLVPFAIIKEFHYSRDVQNCAPCAPNGRENQHYLNGNKDDRSVKDDEDALRDNLAKGLRRTQELEGLVEALKKQLEEGSSPAEAKAQASEELQKERLKSQELEKAVQDLKTRLLEKSEPIVKSTEGLRGLGGESPAQREMDTAKLRQLLEREQEFREKDRLDAEQRLAKVQEEKQQLDTQYKALLGRVAHIRTTLSDKLKSDAVGKPVVEFE
jgi:hypothetical protein